MTKKKTIDATIKVTEKEGKAAFNWLKRQAVAAAKAGKGRTSYCTSDILKGLKVSGGWDDRSRAYRGMIKQMNYAEELGLVREKGWGSPKAFAYIGPEIDAAEKERAEMKVKEKAKLSKAMNALGLKGTVKEKWRGVSGQRFEVTFNASQIIRLAYGKGT